MFCRARHLSVTTAVAVGLVLTACSSDDTTPAAADATESSTEEASTPAPTSTDEATEPEPATEAPATEATGDPADPTTIFPAEMQLAHGAPAWGVYMVVTEPGSDEGLDAANTVAGAAGYRPLALGELSCDQNAAEHLGVDADLWGAALYFETSDEAELVFASFSERGFRPVGIAGVITYCMD